MLRDYIDRQRERLEDLMTGLCLVGLLIVASDELARYERRHMLGVVTCG